MAGYTFHTRKSAERLLLDQGITECGLRGMIDSGISLMEIHRQTGIPYRTIYNQCNRWNIPRGNRLELALAARATKIPASLFIAPLSKEESWLLGLILTDGNITDSGATRITLKDRDGVEAARHITGLGSVKSQTRNGYAAWTWRCDSRHLANRLDLWGAVPRKTETLLMPDLSQIHVPSFALGLWDGDGGWGIDQRDNSLRATFGGASIGFMDSLLTVLTPAIGRRPSLVNREGKGRFWQFWIQGTRAIALARWLYDDPPRYCLERKRTFVRSFLQGQ